MVCRSNTAKISYLCSIHLDRLGMKSIFNIHEIKQILSIAMVSLSCLIILVHAFVPHHHHDCEEEMGFVFENEMACHCDADCDHHHDHDGASHHPFDICKLQELLSHLVLTTKEDESTWVVAADIELPELLNIEVPVFDLVPRQTRTIRTELPPDPLLSFSALRAPPMC